MAVLSDYTSGTISLAQGSVTVTGTGTLFEVTRFREGDTLQIQNLTAVIASVDSDTSLTLTEPWTGTTIVDGPYRARQLGDISRYPTQAATIIDLLGNGVLTNIADIPVEEGKLLRGNAAGRYEAVPEDELGIQDPNGSLTKLAAITLAARQILQTDVNGDLKTTDLLTDQVLVTDNNGALIQIERGTLGDALIRLALGTASQYVRADGTLQTLNKAAVGLSSVENISPDQMPVSAAQAASITTRFAKAGGDLSGGMNIRSNADSAVRFLNGNSGSYGYTVYFNSASGTADNGLQVVHSSTGLLATFRNNGNLSITGTISKAGGTLSTDHPLDPLNKNIRYAFTEGARYYLVHIGAAQLVDGRALIDIDATFDLTPGTFAAMNQNAMVTSLNHQGSFDQVKNTPIEGGAFEIICANEQSSGTVIWTVIGERADAFVRMLDPNCERGTGKFIPEFDKPEYMEPENV